MIGRNIEARYCYPDATAGRSYELRATGGKLPPQMGSGDTYPQSSCHGYMSPHRPRSRCGRCRFHAPQATSYKQEPTLSAPPKDRQGSCFMLPRRQTETYPAHRRGMSLLLRNLLIPAQIEQIAE